jgi:prepilin-type processing-associated H-X9-DG protein
VDVLDYRSSPIRRRRWRPTTIEMLLVVGIVLLLISIFVPSLRRMRETAGHQPCPSNLRQIGQALLLYANDNGGVWPMRLEDLVVHADLLTPQVLVCPTSDDTPAKGSTPQQLAAAYAKPGHVTYIFTRPGAVMNQVGADEVVAYEPVSVHEEGSNAVFGDGHVEFLFAAQLKRQLTKAPTRPAATTAPRSAATAPASSTVVPGR